MTRLLPLLFSGLLLVGVTNCQDKNTEPEPEATLEGTWMPQRVTRYYYNKSGNFSDSSAVDLSTTLQKIVITADTIATYSLQSNTPVLLSAGAYKRQGNTIVSAYGTLTQIKKLTAHSLIFFSKGEMNYDPNAIIGRTDSEVRFSR